MSRNLDIVNSNAIDNAINNLNKNSTNMEDMKNQEQPVPPMQPMTPQQTGGEVNNKTENNVSNNNVSDTKRQENFDKFVKFVESSNKYSDIDSNIFDILKMRFKLPDSQSMKLICSAADEETGTILLDLSDSLLKPFLSNYSDMKKSYLQNCDNLLTILETKLLKKVGENQFTLRELNNIELNLVDRQIKSIISQMVKNCQTKYLKGISLLEKYVIQNRNRSLSQNTNDLLLNNYEVTPLDNNNKYINDY